MISGMMEWNWAKENAFENPGIIVLWLSSIWYLFDKSESGSNESLENDKTLLKMEYPIFESKLPHTPRRNHPIQMREGAILCMELHTHTHTPGW